MALAHPSRRQNLVRGSTGEENEECLRVGPCGLSRCQGGDTSTPLLTTKLHIPRLRPNLVQRPWGVPQHRKGIKKLKNAQRIISLVLKAVALGLAVVSIILGFLA